MELYTQTAYKLSKKITEEYSTSFSSSSKLFDKSIRDYIYAIYGLVRIADEIVDTYIGSDKIKKLDDLERSIYKAIETGFDTNPIVHAFADTAKKFVIKEELIKPFFKSMAMDIKPHPLNRKQYEKYIYGSAEVIGLMCLKVFVGEGNKMRFNSLSPGAKKLGSAYQKVNFLRDISTDFNQLGRSYFPETEISKFDENKKQEIVGEIRKDFLEAKDYIEKLPENSKLAVRTSYKYYTKLLEVIENTPAEEIKTRRVRVSNPKKIQILTATYVKSRLES